MPEGSDLYTAQERPPRAGLPVPPCEFERAYADLVRPGASRRRPPVAACSGDEPTERSFPPPPPGAKPYTLCNGHLRDLFADLEALRSQASSAPSSAARG
jgi:hypothetical protein